MQGRTKESEQEVSRRLYEHSVASNVFSLKFQYCHLPVAASQNH
jgi:hypothetical protein